MEVAAGRYGGHIPVRWGEPMVQGVIPALYAVASVAAFAACAGTLPPKTLVIMVDGLRADAVENGDMPRMRSLMAGSWQPGYGGAWSLSGSTVRDAMTESAPNHVSVATGVSAARHGIGSNADLLYGRHTYGGVAGKPCQTWLSRLVTARKGVKALFIFSWYGDHSLSPDYSVPFLFDRDEANAARLADAFLRPGAPDAVMWYIDRPDHAGHGHGFYPYSPEYLSAVADVDRWIGKVLDAIAARPSFPHEDWLVVVTSDHGGWRRYHGMMSAQAYTIPFIVARRGIGTGCIAGMPRTVDVAPTVLAHFGIDTAAMEIDGHPVRQAPYAIPKSSMLSAPAAHYTFDGSDTSIELRGNSKVVPEGGASGGYLRLSASTNAPGGVLLAGTESLDFTGGFTIVLWARTNGEQKGDPVVLSNKDWNHGANPGVALVAARAVDLSKTAGCDREERRTGAPGFAMNVGCSGRGRQDVGVYDPPKGEWAFYAATYGSDSILRFYQGHPDGRLYCISDDASGCIPASGLPFFLGQDGTGRYRCAFDGDIDEVAIWTHPLTRGEIKTVWKAVKAVR